MTANATSKLDFVLRLIDQVTAPAAKVSKQLMDVAEVGKTGFVQMGAGVAAVTGMIFSFQQSMQPARDQMAALGEVKSLGVAQEALDRLNQVSLDFSTQYGESAQAFVRSAYDIQSAIAGLTGEQLATFTSASNVLAKATKADAATITSYVGTMYGIFKTQADAMGKGEWVENLSGQTALAVQMFKTTGQQMSDAFTAVGANATSAGIGLSEQMAILGQLQATMSGGEAGTKYKAFLSGVGGAQEKLGLQFTDSQGRMLPMLDILEKLQGKFGDTLDVAESDALKKAFGSDEAVGLIKLLMADTASLTNNMEQLGKVKGMEQAEKMAQAMVDPWQRFGSAVEAIRIAFGQTLLPVLNPLMERLTQGAATLQRWVVMFPNIARWIGYVTLGVLGLVAAAGGLTILGGLFTVLSVLASPITLIVLGVVALVAAVTAAIIWWDELKAAFGETAWFQALLAIITPVVLIFRIWWAVMGVLWQGVQQLWAMGVEFVDWLGSFAGATEGATGVWETLLWAFANLSPFALLGNALKGLIELLNKIPGVEIDASFADLPAVPSGAEAMSAADKATAAQKMQQTINAAIPSLSPQRATAVPPGGLLTSIQNTTSQNKGNHIEKVEIHTSKPMSPMELENMMEMAAG
ncbi:phage tail tape measure protein [Pseudomonas mosselii]|uniref:phage tail tape measure protein n=1 Tax=Pseudomonas mosselii TaxID=78327 RepID=UPI003F1E4206